MWGPKQEKVGRGRTCVGGVEMKYTRMIGGKKGEDVSITWADRTVGLSSAYTWRKLLFDPAATSLAVRSVNCEQLDR